MMRANTVKLRHRATGKKRVVGAATYGEGDWSEWDVVASTLDGAEPQLGDADERDDEDELDAADVLDALEDWREITPWHARALFVERATGRRPRNQAQADELMAFLEEALDGVGE